MFDKQKAETFVERWRTSKAHESGVYQQFFVELCDLLGVERPDPSAETQPDFCFEKPVSITHEDGSVTTGSIDFYKKGCFVWESKQGSEAGDKKVGTARRGTATWDKAMRGAYGQALKYASYLPEGKAPFLITCDIGLNFEIWPGFSGDYGGYGARKTYALDKLADPKFFDYLCLIFEDPHELDPAKYAAKVTREVAAKLAGLARALEGKHDPELVAQFLMRCIFTMFSEDVGLLPENLFTNAIRDHWILDKKKFQPGIEQLWKAMKEGLPFGFIGKLLKFNGGLFKSWQSLPMDEEQMELLLEAAECDWSSVEPAIFGTLLERALNPHERKKLGAHFTPREYIERLVRPAVIEPIRADWEVAQAEVRQILEKPSPSRENGDIASDSDAAAEGGLRKVSPVFAEPTDADRKKAIAVIKEFHAKLVATRVLDPACGSGNFLYVTLDLFKEIEAEVMRELEDLGQSRTMELEGTTVNPGQFLGIEINPRAREIADLVLWIGYLQWHRRAFGDTTPPEPVLNEYKNIECRDAILAYDDVKPRLAKDGKPVTVWDMRTHKTHPVTGKQVPDENAQVPVLDYINPHPAEWPQADYVVSNPPFIGNKRMRAALGDGYVETLKCVISDVNGTADFVMYWWNKTASFARARKLRRFGFITTNSIAQTFNRTVIEPHVAAKKNSVIIAWAIPDHPWVDAGADVRIAMTIGEMFDNSSLKPLLGRVVFEESEQLKEPHARRVDISFRAVQKINTDLSGGADTGSLVTLKSNVLLSHQGVNPIGLGYRLAPQDLEKLSLTPNSLPDTVKRYVIGRYIVQKMEERYIIDFFGLTEDMARTQYPKLYHWILERVKPERDTNRRETRKKNWWLYGENAPKMRRAFKGLGRYIATCRTSRHRIFTFLPESMLPDAKLIAICLEGSFFLAVLSSHFHISWSFSTGAWLGVGNDSNYNHSDCFGKFPFPSPSEDQKSRIRDLGDRLDAHRKKVQAEHPDVTLTGMYNALQRLREIDKDGDPLTEKERAFHDRALIGILKQIHDELDEAVAEAYGWPVDISDEEILERLVALNHERAEEEKNGLIRWLRPEFQDPDGKHSASQPEFAATKTKKEKAPKPVKINAWPKDTTDQLKAVRDLLSSGDRTWSVDEVAAAFKRAHKKTVAKHLASLEALGLLVEYTDGDISKWGAVAG
jgi:restriction-modification enzyme MmeI-like protein